MGIYEDNLAANRQFVEQFNLGHLPMPPSKKACCSRVYGCAAYRREGPRAKHRRGAHHSQRRWTCDRRRFAFTHHLFVSIGHSNLLRDSAHGLRHVDVHRRTASRKVEVGNRTRRFAPSLSLVFRRGAKCAKPVGKTSQSSITYSGNRHPRFRLRRPLRKAAGSEGARGASGVLEFPLKSA